MNATEAKRRVLAVHPWAREMGYVGRVSRIPFWRIEDCRKDDLRDRLSPDSNTRDEAWIAAAAVEKLVAELEKK